MDNDDVSIAHRYCAHSEPTFEYQVARLFGVNTACATEPSHASLVTEPSWQ
jgi:hypothetical protein